MENLKFTINEFLNDSPRSAEEPKRDIGFLIEKHSQRDNLSILEIRNELESLPSTSFHAPTSRYTREDGADWVEHIAQIKESDIYRACPEIANKYLN